MGFLDSLRTYAGAWEETGREKLSANEIKSIDKIEVVEKIRTKHKAIDRMIDLVIDKMPDEQVEAYLLYTNNYDEVLKDIGKVTGIDFSKKIRTLGDIKQELANTKKK